jgi:hypothetical protein
MSNPTSSNSPPVLTSGGNRSAHGQRLPFSRWLGYLPVLPQPAAAFHQSEQQAAGQKREQYAKAQRARDREQAQRLHRLGGLTKAGLRFGKPSRVGYRVGRGHLGQVRGDGQSGGDDQQQNGQQTVAGRYLPGGSPGVASWG